MFDPQPKRRQVKLSGIAWVLLSLDVRVTDGACKVLVVWLATPWRCCLS